MLKLSSAYPATWSAAFGDRDLRYNPKVWSLVQDHHAPDDSFVALIDKSDGSTFILRVESLANLDEIDDEDLEIALEEDLLDERFETQWIENSVRSVAGTSFCFLVYGFKNPKFGNQILVNAFARGVGEATILRLAWPRDLPVAASGLPIKLEVLLDGLELGPNE